MEIVLLNSFSPFLLLERGKEVRGEVEGTWKRESDYKKKRSSLTAWFHELSAFSSLYFGQNVFISILHLV